MLRNIFWKSRRMELANVYLPLVQRGKQLILILRRPPKMVGFSYRRFSLIAIYLKDVLPTFLGTELFCLSSHSSLTIFSCSNRDWICCKSRLIFNTKKSCQCTYVFLELQCCSNRLRATCFKRYFLFIEYGNPLFVLRCHRFNICPCVSDDIGLANVTNNYSSSSNESTPRLGTFNGTNREVKVEQCSTARGLLLCLLFSSVSPLDHLLMKTWIGNRTILLRFDFWFFIWHLYICLVYLCLAKYIIFLFEKFVSVLCVILVYSCNFSIKRWSLGLIA